MPAIWKPTADKTTWIKQVGGKGCFRYGCKTETWGWKSYESLLAINHSVVFQLSWKIKRKALGFTAHLALFVLSAKSIPLPSMECLRFGNDFLASSVCLYLRPQTRISELSHKLKVCTSVLQSSVNTGVFVSQHLCHFSKYLENENITSSL